MNLAAFENKPFFEAMKAFFDGLNIPVNCITEKPVSPGKILTKTFKAGNPAHQLLSTLYFFGMVDDEAFDGEGEASELKEIKRDYAGLLVFGVELKPRAGGLFPTRGQLAEITRCFNREYHYTPVIVIFKYSSCGETYISFTSCERTAFKQQWREGEKAGRVSVLKDIRVGKPHSGHLRILKEMTIERTGRKAVNSFAELNTHWQAVFSIKLLNKEFYVDLFNWYLWACKTVNFPKPADDDTDDKTHTSISVIRMLTRMIFCWFIKEKCLVPENLFDAGELAKILKKFDPCSDEKSDYYTAILQNLFFATFNTEMPKDAKGSRKFLEDDKAARGYSEGYLDHLKYRHKERFADPSQALELFKDIPFLNGGLFECLDSRDFKTGKEIRYDGFSSKPSKQPKVPNILFFGADDDVDLSGDFDGDKKKQHVPVRGLIRIFSDFKFTIEENTPLEQEIALDPELLGRVFENLLASYNPETKITARKQTGSFYTPREIVNYMVDESLIAYLKTKLTQKAEVYQELGSQQLSLVGNKAQKGQPKLTITHGVKGEKKEKEIEEKLRRLFDVALDENPFAGDEQIADEIIKYLSNCRILDPAAGSGAFPMGALHKMVYVLKILDKNNIKWKQTQLEKAKADLATAKTMKDEEIRAKAVESAEMRITYIKESFDNPNHELDYARKLFLIEHCIYGVDKQNIAVQICKLRFFISLMVNQWVDINKPNMGILSLPNLETKFVAANTLIGLDKKDNPFVSPTVKKLEQELKEIRQQIFFIRKYSQKKKLKKQEAETREALKEAIAKSGFGKGTATKIAEWNPFDPVHSAPFFDVEMMFGFEGGFEIVIGNPPYVPGKQLEDEFKKYLRNVYKWISGKYDLYIVFAEKGIRLLCENGSLALIIPNAFLVNENATTIRKAIVENSLISSIALYDEQVFEATVESIVLFIHQNHREEIEIIGPGQKHTVLKYKDVLSDKFHRFLTPQSKTSTTIHNKIENNSILLGQITDICIGVQIGGEGDSAEFKNRYVSKTPIDKTYKRMLDGKDYIPFKTDWSGSYLKYGDWLHRKRDEKYFINNKIMVRQVGSVPVASIDYDKYYTLNTIYNVLIANLNYQIEYVFSAINSKTIQFYWKNKLGDLKSFFPKIKKSQLTEIPIRQVPNQYQILIIDLAKQIFKSKKLDPCAYTLPIETRLDALVAHLYGLTEEEYTLILNDLKLDEPMQMACLNEFRDISRGGLE